MKFKEKCLIHAGKSWHERECMVFTEGNLKLQVESKSKIIRYMLSTDSKLLHKIALMIVFDYCFMEGYLEKRGFRK